MQNSLLREFIDLLVLLCTPQTSAKFDAIIDNNYIFGTNTLFIITAVCRCFQNDSACLLIAKVGNMEDVSQLTV